MCFYVHPKKKEPKIAKRNIVCYKYGYIKGKTFTPFYKDYFTYRKEYKTKTIELYVIVSLSWNRPNVIAEGYHSYKSLREAKRERSYNCGYTEIGKFIIPKGAMYYENETQYVSSELVYLGPVRTKGFISLIKHYFETLAWRFSFYDKKIKSLV